MKIVCAGDFHYPYQNENAVRIFYKFIKDIKPDRIFLTGDYIDNWEMSSFRKLPKIEQNTFKEELDISFKELRHIRILCPNSVIYYEEGNHEFRTRKYLMENAPALAFLPNLHLEYLLGLHKLKIWWHGLPENKTRFSHNFYELGHLKIGHGDIIRSESGYTAKSLRDCIGGNIVSGHSHRMGSSPKTYYDGLLVAYENGCMCDLSPDYISNPNWQNGFTYIEANKDISDFNVYQMLIRNGKLLFNGKTYGQK